MNYTYKNITVNVSILNSDWIEFTGDTVMTLPSELVAELIDYNCTFEEFYLGYEHDVQELFEELNEDHDAIVEHFKNLHENVEIRNADAIIAVYEFALQEDEREFSFSVETENVSWVIHDILHAVHDTAGCTIHVESDIERQRIFKSLEITKELFPSQMPDFSFLENLEETFHDRFKEHLDLDEFKYTEEEMYY